MEARCALIRMQAPLIAHHHVVTIDFPDAILGLNILVAFKCRKFVGTISLEREFPIDTIFLSLPFADKIASLFVFIFASFDFAVHCRTI